MNKKDLGIVERYRNSTATTLREVYGRWSTKKEEAYMECVRLEVEMDGYNLRIISHNTDKFSVGFTFVDENGEDCLMYITAGGNRVIRLED